MYKIKSPKSKNFFTSKYNYLLIYSFFLFIFNFLNLNAVFAVQFNGNETGSIPHANAICTEYSGYKNINPDATFGGGSSVPVDLAQLRDVLVKINLNTALSGNELRERNFIDLCRKTPNVAATQREVQNIALRQIKEIADACGDNIDCVRARFKKADFQRAIEAKLDSLSTLDREVAKELNKILNPDTDQAIEIEKQREELAIQCDKEMKTLGYISRLCSRAIAKDALISSIIQERTENALRPIEGRQAELLSEYYRTNGLVAPRRCILTKSGRSPSGIQATDPDCLADKATPLFLTQEAVKNIVALPYNQAFSASAELGPDGVLANLSTRVREGQVFDPDITNNFGSPSGQSGGSPSSGGGLGASGGGSLADLQGAEANYKKLMANATLISNFYAAGKLAYASSTSICASIPVRDRVATIEKVSAAQKPFDDYAKNLKLAWEAALKTPTQNHLNLITQINFDLKDKINDKLIASVREAVVKLLQACVGVVPTS